MDASGDGWWAVCYSKLSVWLEHQALACWITRDRLSALLYIVHVICLCRLSVVVTFSLDCLVLCVILNVGHNGSDIVSTSAASLHRFAYVCLASPSNIAVVCLTDVLSAINLCCVSCHCCLYLRQLVFWYFCRLLSARVTLGEWL